MAPQRLPTGFWGFIVFGQVHTDRLIQTPECMMKRTIRLLWFIVSSSLRCLPIYMFLFGVLKSGDINIILHDILLQGYIILYHIVLFHILYYVIL